MFGKNNSFFKKFFPKESDIIPVDKPLESVYNYICGHINEKFDWGINIIDESIHGKCYSNKIIYKIRPRFTNGIYYKTEIDFVSTSDNACKLIINRNSLKLYRNLWSIIIILSIPFFIFLAFGLNQYTVTINGVSRITEGHPYWILGFPVLFGVIMLIFYFCIKSAKRKAEIFLNNILYKFKND
jgi:hypothetical protein